MEQLPGTSTCAPLASACLPAEAAGAQVVPGRARPRAAAAAGCHTLRQIAHLALTRPVPKERGFARVVWKLKNL